MSGHLPSPTRDAISAITKASTAVSSGEDGQPRPAGHDARDQQTDRGQREEVVGQAPESVEPAGQGRDQVEDRLLDSRSRLGGDQHREREERGHEQHDIRRTPDRGLGGADGKQP